MECDISLLHFAAGVKLQMPHVMIAAIFRGWWQVCADKRFCFKLIKVTFETHEIMIHLLRCTGVCWWFVGVVYIYLGCCTGWTLPLNSASFIFSREPSSCWALFYTLQIVDIDGNIHRENCVYCHPSRPQSYLHCSLNIQFQSDRPSQWCPEQDESDKSMLNLGRVSISKGRCSGYSVATIHLRSLWSVCADQRKPKKEIILEQTGLQM